MQLSRVGVCPVGPSDIAQVTSAAADKQKLCAAMERSLSTAELLASHMKLKYLVLIMLATTLPDEEHLRWPP
jgi:hypothetical protein